MAKKQKTKLVSASLSVLVSTILLVVGIMCILIGVSYILGSDILGDVISMNLPNNIPGPGQSWEYDLSGQKIGLDIIGGILIFIGSATIITVCVGEYSFLQWLKKLRI